MEGLIQGFASLFSTPLVSAIGFIVGILSFFVGLVPLFTNRKPALSYRIAEEVFVTDRPEIGEEFKIYYEGIEVRSLSKARIYLWNSGRNVVRFEDISKSTPLSISFDSGDYLRCYMVAANDSAKALKLVRPDSYVNYIHFEFLNPGEGGIFDVFYDETHSGKPQLKGALAGGKLSQLSAEDANRKPLSKYFLLNFYFYIASAFIGLALPYFYLVSIGKPNSYLYLILSVILSPFGIYIAIYSLLNQPLIGLAPKGLIDTLNRSKKI